MNRVFIAESEDDVRRHSNIKSDVILELEVNGWINMATPSSGVAQLAIYKYTSLCSMLITEVTGAIILEGKTKEARNTIDYRLVQVDSSV